LRILPDASHPASPTLRWLAACCSWKPTQPPLCPSLQFRQALEKLSHDHPSSLLRNGALVAVLSYVDFFQVCLDV